MKSKPLVRGRPVSNGEKKASSTKEAFSDDSAKPTASKVPASNPQRKRSKSVPVSARKPASQKKRKTVERSTVKKAQEQEPVDLSASLFQSQDDDEDDVFQSEAVDPIESPQKKVEFKPQKRDGDAVNACFVISSRIPSQAAVRDYPHRYSTKSKPGANEANGRSRKESRGEIEEEPEVAVIAHYKQARVEDQLYRLGDCVHVYSGVATDYLGRIIEFFEKEDKSEWFGVQWFFRAGDTAIGDEGRDHDKRRVFYSDVKDDNLLECITGKKSVIRVPSLTRFNKGPRVIPPCDYYFDKGYKFAYATFYELPQDLADISGTNSDVSTVESETASAPTPASKAANQGRPKPKLTSRRNVSSILSDETKPELQLLDLYCGCGAMSTGLCLGANLAGANLVTRWAVDLNEFACISMKHNHPETKVRNEAAEDFLALLKEWRKLCDKFSESIDSVAEESGDEGELLPGEYEVERLIGIRWVGHSNKKGEDNEGDGSTVLKPQKGKDKQEPPVSKGLEFKVKWKGYSSEYDTWEPASSMEDCQDIVKAFVLEGKKSKILPLPGDVDVICGGPPCQGASGFNRFRNKAKPLEDPRNKQMVVYMEIVDFLRPRFILMENVVDILKFCEGILGRYALARAVDMNYQAKIGLMVAGSYGLPQFRMRCFLFGASCDEVLPPYPMPTHSVIVRGGVPNQWERCLVAYEQNKQPGWLQKPLVLKDAISDLPPVDNFQSKDDISYEDDPHTSFQRFVRLPKQGTGGLGSVPSKKKQQKALLPDHRPLCLNADDHMRVCQIPKRKGANFRDLKGIIIKEDNTVDVVREPRELLPSGKPLVPDYAVSFIKGRSLKPFGRLWWDETVATVVTRAEPHNHIVLHPEQDRVLSIRENARLQGFPDYYKLFGPIKQRYMQVGNAVAVPVATALGYSLGKSILHQCTTEDETIELPRHFPHSLTTPLGVLDLPDNEEI